MTDLLPIAAQPVRSRLWDLVAEPNIPPGTPSMQRAGPIAEVDTVDPVARMMLRAGIGQTVPQTGRLWELANMATNFAGTTPMRGRRPVSIGDAAVARWDQATADAARFLENGGHGVSGLAQASPLDLFRHFQEEVGARLKLDPASQEIAGTIIERMREAYQQMHRHGVVPPDRSK